MKKNYKIVLCLCLLSLVGCKSPNKEVENTPTNMLTESTVEDSEDTATKEEHVLEFVEVEEEIISPEGVEYAEPIDENIPSLSEVASEIIESTNYITFNKVQPYKIIENDNYLDATYIAEEDDENNPVRVLYQDEIDELDVVLAQHNDGVFNLNDVLDFTGARSIPAVIIDEGITGHNSVRFPILPYDYIEYTFLSGEHPILRRGHYDDVHLDISYGYGTFLNFRFEYKGIVYDTPGIISEADFNSKYKPICSEVELYNTLQYILTNSMEDCEGSFTVFIELSSGNYLPLSIGSKTESLSSDSLADMVSFIQGMVDVNTGNVEDVFIGF